eukprot:Rmarinus@m.27980
MSRCLTLESYTFHSRNPSKRHWRRKSLKGTHTRWEEGLGEPRLEMHPKLLPPMNHKDQDSTPSPTSNRSEPETPSESATVGASSVLPQQDMDPKKQYPLDIIFVFPKPEEGEDLDDEERDLEKERQALLKKLRDGGVDLEMWDSRDGDEVFVRFGVKHELLMEIADTNHMLMKTFKENGNHYRTFSLAESHIFEGASRGFTSGERQRIIATYLRVPESNGGLGLDLEGLRRKGVLSEFFPMHEHAMRQELFDKWILGKRFDQPIDMIREYFGEYVAFYFAWLRFYTLSLVLPSIVGLFLFIYQRNVGVDNPVSMAFAAGIAVWATVFIELWKRRQAELGHLWGAQMMKPPQRVNFGGQQRLGFYEESLFVPLREPDVQKRAEVLGLEMKDVDMAAMHVPYYRERDRRKRLLASAQFFCFSLLVVISGSISVLYYKTVVQSAHGHTAGGLVGVAAASMNSAFIVVTDAIWDVVARKMTEWENYRTEEEFTNALLVKKMMFQFVSHYITLFYIAYVKTFSERFGFEDECLPSPDCEYDEDDPRYDVSEDCEPDCLSELYTQLFGLLVLRQVYMQAKEVLMPKIQYWVQVKYEDYKVRRSGGAAKRNQVSPWKNKALKNMKTRVPPGGRTKMALSAGLDGEEAEGGNELPEEESEAKLNTFEDLFDDYNEMAIQFGYVTLFSCVFPLAPVASLINNLIEMRTDAWKLVEMMQRPMHRPCQNIGHWLTVLQVVSYVAVFNNMLIIGTVGSALDNFSDQMKIFLCVLYEHAVFLLVYIVAQAIPDVPAWIMVENSRQEWIFKSSTDPAGSLPIKQNGSGGPISHITHRRIQQREQSSTH